MQSELYLRALKDAATAVASSTNQQQALDTAVAIVARRLEFDVCSIYLIDPKREVLVLAASQGLLPSAVGSVTIGLDEGLTGRVARDRRPLFSSNARSHPDFKLIPQTGEEELTTYGGVPLLRGDRLVGVLTVQTVRHHEFVAAEVVMLETLARIVVSVIEVARLVQTERVERPVDCLSGLGTSPGIVLAPASLMAPSEALPLQATAFTSVADETAAFHAARKASIEEASGVIDQLRDEGVSAEATDIIAAHQALLADPKLSSAVEEAIADGVSAAHAVDGALAPLIERLEALEAMQEKAHDLRDIRGQLLRHLGIDDGISLGPQAGSEAVVIVANTLTPAQTATFQRDQVAAIVTEHGSAMSHLSILARSRGIPAVVGVEGLLERVKRADRLLVDGDNGFVFVDPDDLTVEKYLARREEEGAERRALEDKLRQADVADAPTRADIQVNLGFSGEVDDATAQGARAVGLLRTEFFFLHQRQWPDRALQRTYYDKVLAAFPEVTVRLVDVGGDKRLPYLDHLHEPNPILGYRSVRLLLDRIDVLRTQYEAILESAREHPKTRVRVMVPMVTTLWEMQAARDLFEEVQANIWPGGKVPFGMMIEVPAVLWQLEDYLPISDFFSLGTNDLVQYLMAVDRDNEFVRNRYQPHNPGVLRALDHVSRILDAAGRTPTVCGEMAAAADTALALFSLGYRRLSVSLAALPRIRYLAQATYDVDLSGLRAELLAMGTSEEVDWTLRDALREFAPLLPAGL